MRAQRNFGACAASSSGVTHVVGVTRADLWRGAARCGLWLSWRTSTFRICNMHWGLGWSSVLQRPRRVASFFARLAMCRLAPILIVPADREHVPHSHVRKFAQPRVLSMPSRPRISPVSTPASSIRGRQSSASPLAVQIANSEAQSVYLCYIP